MKTFVNIFRQIWILHKGNAFAFHCNGYCMNEAQKGVVALIQGKVQKHPTWQWFCSKTTTAANECYPEFCIFRICVFFAWQWCNASTRRPIIKPYPDFPIFRICVLFTWQWRNASLENNTTANERFQISCENKALCCCRLARPKTETGFFASLPIGAFAILVFAFLTVACPATGDYLIMRLSNIFWS